MDKLESFKHAVKNLSAVFHKNAMILSKQYNDWLKNLSKQPGYNKFINDISIQYNLGAFMDNYRTN